jgi:hypothetical protein
VLELLLASGESGIARALRASGTLYASMNAAHILGLALLVGAILPLDMRIAGAFRSVALADLARVLRPVAVTGLALATLTGALLFTVNPADYLANPAFRLKLLLLLAALANLIAIERSPAFHRARAGHPPGTALRAGALASAMLWIATLLAGRWIGFL